MSKKVRLKSDFVWDEVKLKAAEGLAKGEMLMPLANSLGINERTLRRWQEHPDFKLKISAIIKDIDISLKANRIKIAKEEVERVRLRLKGNEDSPTSRDLITALKYVAEETGDYEPKIKQTGEFGIYIIDNIPRKTEAKQIDESECTT